MSDPGPRRDDALFDSTSFDLESYLARIQYQGDRTATLQTLQAIAVRHPASIPFESIDALARRPIALDPQALQKKLVQHRRGGWCYEHNLLFGHALTSLGFHVTGLAARVRWEVPAGLIRPRTHMVLRIDLDEPYLVDVGFGGLTLTGVLRLVPGLEQQTPHEMFRIRSGGSADGRPVRNPPHASDDFILEASVRGEWRPLYSLDLQPQVRADYEATNWYLSNHPDSFFLSRLVAARVDPGRRYALLNSELAVHHLDGSTERRVLTSAREIRQVLDELFHIDVPAGTDVDAALERLTPATA